MPEKWYIYNAKCCGLGIVRGPTGWNRKGHPIGGTYCATLEERMKDGSLNILGEFLDMTLINLCELAPGDHAEIKPPVVVDNRGGPEPEKPRDYSKED